MTFFAELKRRNVIRVAIAYAVVAWLVLQVADVMLNNFDAPHWLFPATLKLLAIGFPLVLVFAWAFELTPEGIKREHQVDRSKTITAQTGQKLNRITIGALILAVSYFAVDKFYISEIRKTEAIEFAVEEAASKAITRREAEAAQTFPSIAVLPFLDMSPERDQEYFATGLSEDLLNMLAQVPQLKVAARTSSFSFQDQNLEVPEIARRLNVAHILEGSIRTSGDRVRVNAQLIHAQDGFQLWAQTYDRTLDDIFAIQDEIAAAVVTQLKIALLGAAPVAETTDPEAYSLYLKAHHLTWQNTSEAYDQAVTLLQKAISIDPDYVQAWSELAAVYSGQASSGLRPIDEGYELARLAANKALEINPDFARGYAWMGRISLGYDNNFPAAAKFLERGLELEPTNTQVLTGAGRLSQSLGRQDQAIAIGKHLVARDPVNANGMNMLGISYLYAGRWDDAITAFSSALAMSPGYFGAHYRIGSAMLGMGDAEAALVEMQKEVGDDEYRLKGTALALHDLGREDEFQATFAELRERFGAQWPSEMAQVYAWTGDADAAFEWLDKAVAQNEDGLNEQFVNQFYAPIHDDPRWEVFRERTGTSDAQLAAIEFDVSVPE